MSQEFEEEKRKELEQDAPHSVDTTLPGWVDQLLLHHTSQLLTRCFSFRAPGAARV